MRNKINIFLSMLLAVALATGCAKDPSKKKMKEETKEQCKEIIKEIRTALSNIDDPVVQRIVRNELKSIEQVIEQGDELTKKAIGEYKQKLRKMKQQKEKAEESMKEHYGLIIKLLQTLIGEYQE